MRLTNAFHSSMGTWKTSNAIDCRLPLTTEFGRHPNIAYDESERFWFHIWPGSDDPFARLWCIRWFVELCLAYWLWWGPHHFQLTSTTSYCWIGATDRANSLMCATLLGFGLEVGCRDAMDVECGIRATLCLMQSGERVSVDHGDGCQPNQSNSRSYCGELAHSIAKGRHGLHQ